MYCWSEALGEVVDPKGDPVLAARDGSMSPHRPASRPGSMARSRPASRARKVSGDSRGHLARATSLHSLPSNGRPKSVNARNRARRQEEKAARIAQLEEAKTRQSQEVELLRRQGEELGGEVGEAVERRIREMMLDDPEVEIDLVNM